MSKQYTNSTKVNGATYQKSKKQGFIPTSKKKKWTTTHTAVLILVLIWTIGSVLGTISVILRYTDKNSTNVAYADEVTDDNISFTFNTVELKLNPYGVYVVRDSNGDILDDYYMYASLPTSFFRFSLNFGNIENSMVYFYNDFIKDENGNKLLLISNLSQDVTQDNNGVNPIMYSTFNIARGYHNDTNSNLPTLYKNLNWYLGRFDNSNANYGFTVLDYYSLLDNTKTYTIDYADFTIGLAYNSRFTNTNFYIVDYVLETDTTSATGFDVPCRLGYRYYNENNEIIFLYTNFFITSEMFNTLYNGNPILYSYRRYTTLTADNQVAFDEGRQLGLSQGYNNGYREGYDTGSNIGYYNGYYQGKIDGVASANEYSFLGLLSAVIDAPIQALGGLLNFTILGINMADFFYAILTLCLFIAVCKIVIKSVV